LNQKRKSGREFSLTEQVEFERILETLTKTNIEMSTVKEDIVSVDTNNQVDNSWLASSVDGDYFNEQRMSIPNKPTEEVLV
jgi:hypothetical protein